MKEYIYSSKSGVYIINLRKTLEKLKEAYEYALKLGMRGGRVLFIGTKVQARETLKQAAEDTNGYYVTWRWLGGTLTNFSTLRQSVNNLERIQNLAGEELAYEGILKKEASKMEKQRQKMMKLLGGIRTMKRMPAAVFLIDPVREHIALKEANFMGLPVVSVVDTNCNPEKINYLIPGNDDSEDAVKLFVNVFVAGLLEGRKLFDKKVSPSADFAERDKTEKSDGVKKTNAETSTETVSKTNANVSEPVASEVKEPVAEANATESEKPIADPPVAEANATESEKPVAANPDEPPKNDIPNDNTENP